MTERHSYNSSYKGWRAFTILWIALAFVFGGVSALAQSGAGAIQGTVTDPTGAVVPGAVVHVVNTATGAANDTKSNGVGFYSVPGLFAGHYTVTFTATGMKQFQTSVQLQVAQTAVIAAKLPLGDVSEKVTVEADTQQLATYENGTIGNDLDNKRINQLPMNQRNIMSLVGMSTPGLEAGGTRANGLMTSGISYVQDGTPIDNRDYGGPSTQTDPDAIQEVRVETSASNAMYATPATAVITTKSGTNSLHGSLFETARNNGLAGPAKSRANPANYAAPRLIRNEFGGSVGGPIFIPKIYNGKDKSFFFFAYERLSLISGTYANAYVPTQAERNGDFSGLVNGNGILDQLYDSQTTAPSANCNGTGVANAYCRAPFANNQIPTNRLSPLAKSLYAITPLPTNSSNPLLNYNIAFPAANNQTAPTISTRLDHVFNESNNMYVRYTYLNSNAISPYGSVGPTSSGEPATIAGAGMPANASNLIDTLLHQSSAAIGFTHIFSPTFVS
ncbi:hypothetical protein GCM10011507_32700 [Edaphobacter acidisoli]|uniref:TonB-dependent transporter Oar-like beta-barrel domain-containing protein n=1 Tax=Edaphobacter acidisoli TaxID=2040573 RepID=A0A916S082_9BACT|nr:carboxypeptidase-like regulatory domain-containing protein [Edaphobacter acidisoli]GGA78898.1 hypothetical protein GCM10011507_32700 [Edaphobacter acidisoli]